MVLPPLFEQADEVAVRVAQEPDPEFMVRHLRGQLGSALLLGAPDHQFGVQGLDSGGVKECEVGSGTKQEVQAKDVPVETQGNVNVGPRGFYEVAGRGINAGQGLVGGRTPGFLTWGRHPPGT
jgi:hypothetical protein